MRQCAILTDSPERNKLFWNKRVTSGLSCDTKETFNSGKLRPSLNWFFIILEVLPIFDVIR